MRIIHGDMNPAGPGYKEAHVPSGIEGARDGNSHCGSWACVDGNRHFARLRSMTLQAIVWPTRPGGRAQTIMSLWNPTPARACGWISMPGASWRRCWRKEGGPRPWPAASPCWRASGIRWPWRSSGRGRAPAAPRLRSRRRPRPRAAAAIGAGAGRQTLLAFAATPAPAGASSNGGADERQDRPSRLSAARWTRQRSARWKIRRSRACARPAWWGVGFLAPDGIRVDRDISGNQLHGRTLNLPVRAMKGANWTGNELAPRPGSTGAMHFHDDSVHDAGWETDFADRAGIAAVRPVRGPSALRDDEEFIPFVVRATPAGQPHRLPGAHRQLHGLCQRAHAHRRALAQLLTDQVAVLRKNDVFLSEHREYGNSCYDVHSDGAGVCYTSRLRPILNMRPKYRSWLGGRGSALWQFNADTHVTDWLEAAGLRLRLPVGRRPAPAAVLPGRGRRARWCWACRWRSPTG